MPSTNLRYIHVQVTMASTPRVESFKIPYGGSLPYIVDFHLVIPGTSDISIDDCNTDEELLGLIPKIWAPERDEQTFSWKHRSVAILPAKDIANHEGHCREVYVLYTCRDEEAGTYRKSSSTKHPRHGSYREVSG